MRASLVAVFILVCEWSRVEIARQPGLTLAALVVGGRRFGSINSLKRLASCQRRISTGLIGTGAVASLTSIT